jgi:hypothetical protein
LKTAALYASAVINLLNLILANNILKLPTTNIG